MNIDGYVPNEDDVRETWVAHESKCAWGPYHGDPSADFDRFLARVRRDAAREALDGLARKARADWHPHLCGWVGAVDDYRDQNYPEENPVTVQPTE